MPRANDGVERALNEYADLLSILTDDRFKPRAYEKAARAVGGYASDLAQLDRDQILRIPGVGASIAEKIHTFLAEGSFPELEALRDQIPPGVREMTAIPGLGPKKAIALYEQLGVASLDQLSEAINDDRLAALKGFGRRTQENLAKGIRQLASSGGRVGVGLALDTAEALLAELDAMPSVRRSAYAGSLRRMEETIGDVDLLAASDDPASVMDRFITIGPVARVLAHGETKSSILTQAGLQIDLRVIPEEAWGAAMIYFTGSKAHNVKIREMAVRAGLKLNEYGIYRADSGELLAASSEEAVYEQLGLPFIPPTLREDRGEIEAALAGGLPDIVQLARLKGDLHTHTDLTDGTATLREMLDAASTLRYSYVAVTDHAPNLVMQRMTDAKILDQRGALDQLRPRYPRMRLLHGTELNIDPDGNVDWDADFLAGFDVTVASVHSSFGSTKEQQTRRVIRAMENPNVNVIGHLTGRKIGKRAPIDLDLEAIFAAAARTGTALEINSHPDRLDLKDDHIRWARDSGAMFAIDSDAHAPQHLRLMRFGVATAQRGWLEADRVINTWPRARLERFLRKGRDR